MDCLLQPAVTLVNISIRLEALPIFYSINKFHFEMDNFKCEVGGHCQNIQACPSDWWRSIGDTNLRYILHFTIASPAIMFEYCQRSRTVEMSRDHDRLSEATLSSRVISELAKCCRRACRIERDRREAKVLQPLFEMLQNDGLHVRAIENLVIWLELREMVMRDMKWREIKYLRDSSALEGPSRSGVHEWPGVEDVEVAVDERG